MQNCLDGVVAVGWDFHAPKGRSHTILLGSHVSCTLSDVRPASSHGCHCSRGLRSKRAGKSGRRGPISLFGTVRNRKNTRDTDGTRAAGSTNALASSGLIAAVATFRGQVLSSEAVTRLCSSQMDAHSIVFSIFCKSHQHFAHEGCSNPSLYKITQSYTSLLLTETLILHPGISSVFLLRALLTIVQYFLQRRGRPPRNAITPLTCNNNNTQKVHKYSQFRLFFWPRETHTTFSKKRVPVNEKNSNEQTPEPPYLTAPLASFCSFITRLYQLHS